MKLKKTVWRTDDDCASCGHRGMIYHFNFFDENGDMFGSLRCPACGATASAYCVKDEIPSTIPPLTS